MKIHLCLQWILVFAFIAIFDYHHVWAEEVKSRTTITTIEVEKSNSAQTASIDQLVVALVGMDGETVRFSGKIQYNYFEELVFETSGGVVILLDLDDGREISKKVLLCKDNPCEVDITLDLSIRHFGGRILLNAVGYDVVFSEG